MFHYNESSRVQDITAQWGAGCYDWDREVVYKRIVLPGSAGPRGLSVKGGPRSYYIGYVWGILSSGMHVAGLQGDSGIICRVDL